MSETNKRTIAAYNEQVQGYVSNTPHEISRTATEWLDNCLEGLPNDVRILEIGSGFGHDAAYIEQKGYSVERTDVTLGFVNLLRSQAYTVKQLNVLTDEISGPYDLIIADAVYHHFTAAEAAMASGNVLGALGIGGRFAVSLRLGLHEGWSDEKLGVPRYFTHWERSGIEAIIKAVGFASITAVDGDRVNFPWLHLIAQKE